MNRKSQQSAAPGSLRVDRSFSGIGRIQVRTGTTNRRIRDAMDAMLVSMFQRGQYDLLHAVADGRIGITELFRMHQRNELGDIVLVEDVVPLSDALADFLAHAKVAEQTRKTYGSCFKLLNQSSPNASVAELHQVLLKYREECEARGVGRNFNLTKAACMSFGGLVKKCVNARQAAAFWVDDTAGTSRPSA